MEQHAKNKSSNALYYLNNICITLYCACVDHMPSYVWRCPGRPLIERRKRAERRREELLHIFYQGNVITGLCASESMCVNE